MKGSTAVRSKARVALGAATAAGITAGVVGVTGVGTASAHPVSVTLDYTCSAFWISERVSMEIRSDIPDAVAVGKASRELPLDATTTVSKEETHLIHRIGGLKSIGGTVDATAELRSREGDVSVPVHFAIDKTAVPGSDRAFTVTAKGSFPSRTFHRTGKVQIAVGDLSVKLVGQKANGQALGSVNPACKLVGRSQPVVASFEVTGTQTPTSPPAPGASGTGTGTGTTAGSPAPGASGTGSTTGSPSATPSAPDGTARGALAHTGQDTLEPMLLAVGALAAGGGFLLLGLRLKRRRRAGDDG